MWCQIVKKQAKEYELQSGHTSGIGTLDRLLIFYAALFYRTFVCLIYTYVIVVDPSSFFDTVRNHLVWEELLSGQGGSPHVVLGL